MRFKYSENEIQHAIDILDKLINSRAINAIETIKNYKISKNFDMFTSYRLNKELNRMNNFNKGR